VIVSFSAYLFYLYHRNFILVLDIQVNTLFYVENNNFDASVPIVSDDEFALLAEYYNSMIERLRDRERVYRTLEKSVGANIMNKLLTTDEQTLKQGQSYSVAILFCDLRGFTSLSESASAEDVILFLNDYFAHVSAVISQHNGIINKFMGDAVLAIFGLEKEGNAVQDAVNASLAIIQHNIDLYMPNEMHPETGVGIDFGWVVGGTIGSEERYEYTIIGDAVNKASRLEGLSKRLDYSIILSKDAYQQLSEELREHFCDLGEHKVRGRNEAINVYGCGKKRKKTESSQARQRE
jgi:adenylate cyclase